jgi:hypothetical protein
LRFDEVPASWVSITAPKRVSADIVFEIEGSTNQKNKVLDSLIVSSTGSLVTL